MQNRSGLLSIILLSYYSKERIVNSFNNLKELLDAESIKFEFIIIDDGSTDISFDIALKLEQEFENVIAYQLSRNYTSHYAIFAGLSVCNGDCAVPIPDDEQQPYQTIVDMYRLWQNGENIVIPYRTKRNDGFFTDLWAKAYYRTINTLSDVKYPDGGADTFFIDREVINLVNEKIHPINTSILSEVFRLGFKPHFYPYERVRGINKKSRWTFRKKLKQAKDTFFSTSTYPVKIITNLGMFFSLFALGIIFFYSYIRLFGNPLFWGSFMPGWTSTVVIISFFSGIILFSLGIIAEYIWRIYEEVKNRPGYIIRKKSITHNKQ